MNGDAWVSSTHRPMGFPEFVIVIASIMALNPLAMDMMLPALPNIGSIVTRRNIGDVPLVNSQPIKIALFEHFSA